MIDFQKLECPCLSGTPENPCWIFLLVCTRIRLNQDFQDTCVGVFFLGWLSTLAKRRSFSRPQTMMGKEGRRKMILKCFLFWGSDLGRGPIFRGKLAGLSWKHPCVPNRGWRVPAARLGTAGKEMHLQAMSGNSGSWVLQGDLVYWQKLFKVLPYLGQVRIRLCFFWRNRP